MLYWCHKNRKNCKPRGEECIGKYAVVEKKRGFNRREVDWTRAKLMQGGHGARHEDSGSACAPRTPGGGFEGVGCLSFGKYNNIMFIPKFIKERFWFFKKKGFNHHIDTRNHLDYYDICERKIIIFALLLNIYANIVAFHCHTCRESSQPTVFKPSRTFLWTF